MDVDVKGAAIGVASAVYASVGFLLSVVAVVLNPLIPSSPANDNPHEHYHPSLILHGKHHRTRPGSDLSAAAPASQIKSTISASSQASSSSSALSLRQSQSPSPPPLYEEHSGTPTPMPLGRSSNDRQRSLPAANDYFSSNPAGISAAVGDARAETRSSGTIPAAPTPPPLSGTSNLSLPNTPQPFLSRRPTPASHTPTAASTSQPATPTPASIPPLIKPHTCTVDEAPPHSFRISNFKRPWTGRRDKPTRSATCPEPASSLLPPDSTSTADVNTNNATVNAKAKRQAISRPPSTSSIKHFCPVKKTEKTLRKSLSSPESGLSKWKPHRRKCTNAKTSTNPTPNVSQSQLHLQPPPSISPPRSQSRSRTQAQPRPRTQPYEAPYFFPSPASPDAGDYIRRAKSSRPSSAYAYSYPPYSGNGNGSTPPSSYRQLPLGEDGRMNNMGVGIGIGPVEDEKAASRRVYAERGVASAPPTKLKFAGI